MKLTFQYKEGQDALVIESNGEGRYKISSDATLARQNSSEYETDDGLHVLGLIQLYFSANDSREYLLRRLNEHKKEQKCKDT